MAAAAPNADVHAALIECDIRQERDRNRIISNEGFQTLRDIGIMETDADVADMAKRLASRPQASRVNLGTVQIKRIQALVWWIHDCQKHLIALDVNNFTPDTLERAIENKRIQKEQASAEVTTKDLSKFDPDNYEIHEDAFLNMLSQTYGSQGETLCYITRAVIPPTNFADEMERRMYQLPLNGASFEADNRIVYRKLKSFLIDSPGWAWIEPFNATKNGRNAFLAWSNHYNGYGELSKRTALAKARLDGLHYKNKRSMSFERYIELLTKSFSILEKDKEERYTERQKVEKLLKGY